MVEHSPQILASEEKATTTTLVILTAKLFECRTCNNEECESVSVASRDA